MLFIFASLYICISGGGALISHLLNNNMNENKEKMSLLKASRALFFTITLSLVMLICYQSHAKTMAGIVATVNEEAISAADLDARMRIALSASGLPNTDEVKRNLLPQIIRTLIDERLKRQEAEKAGMSVTDEDIDKQIDAIALKNQVSRDEFLAKMKQDNVPLAALKDQIAVDLLWSQYVQRRLKPQVNINRAEVEAEINRLKGSVGQDEYRLAEIYIETPSIEDENETRAMAERLVAEIKKGAPFPALARQFSASPTAATGGDLGWVKPGDLSEDILNESLAKLDKGQLSPPIRAQNGYYIYYVISKRKIQGLADNDITMNLKRIFVADENVNAQTRADIRENVRGCISMENSYRHYVSEYTGDINNVSLESLSPVMRDIVSDLDLAQISRPVSENGGLSYYMVCKRTYSASSGLPTEQDISDQIGLKKLDLLQKQRLRQARNAAFIDIRL